MHAIHIKAVTIFLKRPHFKIMLEEGRVINIHCRLPQHKRRFSCETRLIFYCTDPEIPAGSDKDMTRNSAEAGWPAFWPMIRCACTDRKFKRVALAPLAFSGALSSTALPSSITGSIP
jgi:hypothetical protein